jgi:hypothetical protein
MECAGKISRIGRYCLFGDVGKEIFDRSGFLQVFEKARAYKARNKSENVLPVVLLDEVGLAEVSRHNPLKVRFLLIPFSSLKYFMNGCLDWWMFGGSLWKRESCSIIFNAHSSPMFKRSSSSFRKRSS